MHGTGYAYFVRHPRTIDDLSCPHPVEREQPYSIVKTVTLSAIDYENFLTDMLADRQFIEDSAALCGTGDTLRCLFVRRHGLRSGVLVMPEKRRWVGYAAWRSEEPTP